MIIYHNHIIGDSGNSGYGDDEDDDGNDDNHKDNNIDKNDSNNHSDNNILVTITVTMIILIMIIRSWHISTQCSMHASVNQVSIGSDNGLLPTQRQAII